MAGGRGKRPQGVVTRGRRSSVVYLSDKRLVPRIREYLGCCDAGMRVDIDNMALQLQADYSEYARKKRAAFRNVVAKAYRSMSDHCSAEQSLQCMEQRHLRRRATYTQQSSDVDPVEVEEEEECSLGELSSDSEAEFEASLPEDCNMMNDALLQVYGSSQSVPPPPPPQSHSQTPITHSQMTVAPHNSVHFAAISVTRPVVGVSTSGNETGEHSMTTTTTTTTTDQPTGQGSNSVSGLSCVSLDQTPSEAVLASPPVAPSTVVCPVTSQTEPPLLPSSGEPLTPGEPIDPEAGTATKGGRGSPCDLSSGKSLAAGLPDERERRLVTFDAETSVAKRTKHGRRASEREGAGQEDGRSGRRKRLKREGRGERSDVDTAVKDALKEKHSPRFPVEQPTLRFSDVGGIDSVLTELCRLLLHLQHPEVFKHLGVRPLQGFLLHGPPGCGKTLLASAIAGELSLPLIRLAATEVVSGVSGESEETIRELFKQAKDCAPCVLFIDEVDAICPRRDIAQREMERRIVTQLLTCMDDIYQSSSGAPVLVIGATNRPDSLEPALRRAGRFDREISLGIPGERARESILKVLCRGLKLDEGVNFGSLAHQTPGYVGADLMALVREASLCAVSRILSDLPHSSRCEIGVEGEEEGGVMGCVGGEGVGGEPLPTMQWLRGGQPLSSEQLGHVAITSQDFQLALPQVQPSAKREGFVTVPGVSWDDVGALESVREELSIAILAPVRYPQQFASLGLSSPPGILLVGPPGCGKTLLAKAVANQTGINFISVKGPELLNMYVGESERAVRQVFQRARNSAPCVIFFDELDALCPRRSEMAETSASARVVNQLLTEMDGLESRRQVFIMAATNRPDIIDPAVLRPGRLDKILYVGLPSALDRAAILRTITKAGTQPSFCSDVDLQLLASDQYSQGFSGADLSALVREAAVTALKEHVQLTPLECNVSNESDCSTLKEDCKVSMRNFIAALKKVKASVTLQDRAKYDEMSVQLTAS